MLSHLDDFQEFLLRSGVNIKSLLKDDPWLQSCRPTPEACNACRKLMWIPNQGRRDGVPPWEAQAFFTLRDAARRRREKHLAMNRSVVDVLSTVQKFRHHQGVVERIASFLLAPGSLPDTEPVCLCVAEGFCARANGVLEFLAHVQSSHQ